MDTKQCSKCKKIKILSEFNRHSKKPDGRQNFCRNCQRQHHIENVDRERAHAKAWVDRNRERHYEHTRAWAKRNPKKVSEFNRKFRELRPEVAVANNKRYKERYPEKIEARRITKAALLRGELAKPDHCERCLEPKEPRQLDGHHEDYSKPLEVRWVCRQCHTDIHTEKRGGTPRKNAAPSFDCSGQFGDTTESVSAVSRHL